MFVLVSLFIGSVVCCAHLPAISQEVQVQFL